MRKLNIEVRNKRGKIRKLRDQCKGFNNWLTEIPEKEKMEKKKSLKQ